jgi:hypothetical protein
MRFDTYTKAVLTVIAIALMGIFVNSVTRLPAVSAQSPADYSRLQVSADGKLLVVYNNMSGQVDILDLYTGKPITGWQVGYPISGPSGTNP